MHAVVTVIVVVGMAWDMYNVYAPINCICILQLIKICGGGNGLGTRLWTPYESGTIIGRFNTLRAFLRAIVSASAELSCMLRNPWNTFLADKKHAQW